MFLRKSREKVVSFGKQAGRLFIKTHILTIWLVLCVLGYVIGTQASPPSDLNEDVFENLRVLSYRNAPSDSVSHFVVELSARGKAFRQYDVDMRRFIPVSSDREYWRSVTGTSYAPLSVRGHVSRGVWLEMPATSVRSPLPEQYDELYRSTINLVSPLSVLGSAIGIVSGLFGGTPPRDVGEIALEPGRSGRAPEPAEFRPTITREAWRRVALEPALVFDEKDPASFAATSARQRLYTNFLKLSVRDTDGFIPYEAARLDSAGAVREAGAMRAFAAAVQRASEDSVHLTSADFSAVEEWASLIDRRGHWAVGTSSLVGIGRIQCLGALAWYGLAPESDQPRRVWVGPRLLLDAGERQAFIPDEIPEIAAACPVGWQDWMKPDDTHLGAFAFTARWMRDVRRWVPNLRPAVGVAVNASDAPPPAPAPAALPRSSSSRPHPAGQRVRGAEPRRSLRGRGARHRTPSGRLRRDHGRARFALGDDDTPGAGERGSPGRTGAGHQVAFALPEAGEDASLRPCLGSGYDTSY
jgi:hypothetical protein